MTKKPEMQQTDKDSSGHHLASCNNHISFNNKASLPQAKQRTGRKNESFSLTKVQRN